MMHVLGRKALHGVAELHVHRLTFQAPGNAIWMT